MTDKSISPLRQRMIEDMTAIPRRSIDFVLKLAWARER